MADNTPGKENTPRQSGLSWSQPSGTARPSQTGATTSSTSQSSPKFISSPVRPAAPAQPSSRRSVLLFASGVVVGGLLAWSWFSLTPEGVISENSGVPAGGTAATGGSGAPTSGTGAALSGSEALVVPSPQDAGLSVRVTSAPVTQPTWVVVYEIVNGERGNALGARLFFLDSREKTINLLRPTQAGNTYWIGKRTDNGDERFSMTLDQPVVNAA